MYIILWNTGTVVESFLQSVKVLWEKMIILQFYTKRQVGIQSNKNLILFLFELSQMKSRCLDNGSTVTVMLQWTILT